MSIKPHISATQLEMYARCPEQYRRRYVENERLAPGVALLRGTGMHRAAEFNFRQKIKSHEDLPANEVSDFAVSSVRDDVTQGGIALTSEEKRDGIAAALDDLYVDVDRFARTHIRLQARDYQPVQVEHTTRICLPNCSRDLLAVTDLRDDVARVTDFKTGAKPRTQHDVITSTQLTIYAAAYHYDLGSFPDEVRLDVLTGSRLELKRQLLRADRSIAEIEALGQRISATVAAIDAGIFPPTSPQNWWCSERWCGYYRSCRYVTSRSNSRKDTKHDITISHEATD